MWQITCPMPFSHRHGLSISLSNSRAHIFSPVVVLFAQLFLPFYSIVREISYRHIILIGLASNHSLIPLLCSHSVNS